MKIAAGLIKELRGKGHARLGLSAEDGAVLADLHREAERFFACEEATKRRHMSDDFNFGFRPFGRQYSITPDRPDLNESFTYWANDPRTIPGAKELPGFMAALSAYWKLVASIGEAAIEECARELDAAPTGLDLRTASYIEINSYFESPERDLLQDRHEDGHLLTILHSTAAGLEIEVEGQMAPVSFTEGELVLMPGSLLTDLTGGWIAPLFHQVRNHGLAERRSVLFLLNPAIDRPIVPFRVTDQNRGVDIAERARTNGHDFGLPDAPVLPGRTGP